MEEIIIQTSEEKVCIIVLENGKIVEYYEYDKNNLSKIGNICIGQVTDVVAKNNTLFVDVGEEKPGFLQLESLDKKYKKGDKVIVQIKKDSTEKKGAKLSNKLSIASQYIVLLINSKVYTFSSKLENVSPQTIEKIKAQIPPECGFIIRTEAKNVTEDVLLEELHSLVEKNNQIRESIQNEDVGVIFDVSKIEQRVMHEFVKSTTKSIYTNDKEIYEKLAEINDNRIQINYSNTNYIDEFGLETEYEKISQRKIWLKSGGFIVFDKTEAMTVIDVNTGKFTGKRGFEQETTAFETNKEATFEIAKQIRLKNIGGIIIIDYINMHEEENKQSIIEIMKKECLKDRSKVEVIDFTALGLLEITRKKI